MNLLYNPACHQGESKQLSYTGSYARVAPRASVHTHPKGGEGGERSHLGVQDATVLCCDQRVPPLITSYIELVSANVKAVQTPKPKHVTITTGSPMCSKMRPLKYFSRSGNGFLLSHSAFISSSDYEHALRNQLCHALSVWLWAGYLNTLQI